MKYYLLKNIINRFNYLKSFLVIFNMEHRKMANCVFSALSEIIVVFFINLLLQDPDDDQIFKGSFGFMEWCLYTKLFGLSKIFVGIKIKRFVFIPHVTTVCGRFDAINEIYALLYCEKRIKRFYDTCFLCNKSKIVLKVSAKFYLRFFLLFFLIFLFVSRWKFLSLLS